MRGYVGLKEENIDGIGVRNSDLAMGCHAFIPSTLCSLCNTLAAWMTLEKIGEK
jgi:hypothetical protein